MSSQMNELDEWFDEYYQDICNAIDRNGDKVAWETLEKPNISRMISAYSIFPKENEDFLTSKPFTEEDYKWAKEQLFKASPEQEKQ